MRKTHTALAAAAVATLMSAGVAAAAPSQTGPSSSDSPYLDSAVNGTVLKSVLTVGDTADNGYVMAGLADGLGAFDNGDGTFTVLMNHEINGTSGRVRDHGAPGSFVSKWTIEKGSMRVLAGDDLIQRVYTPTAGGWAPLAGALNRLCSADLADQSAFYDAATDRGTRHRIFLNGEEAGSEGRAFAHVVDGPDAGSSYELPALGKASWENQVAMPGTGTQTVVVGTDDSGGGQIYVYVGEKKAEGNDVERAGLTGGKLYGLKIAGVATENDATVVPEDGVAFGLVEIPGAAAMTGAQLEQASASLGASKLARPEDASFDPSDESGLYFATTGSFQGISRLWHLAFADAGDVTQGGVAEVAVASPAYDAAEGADQAGPRMIDNLTVNDRGQVLLQEDPGGQDYLAGIFQYDPASGAVVRVARHKAELFSPGGSAFVTRDEESSGIIAVPFLGAGKYLFTDQVHAKTNDPETVERGQLLLMNVAPGKPVQ